MSETTVAERSRSWAVAGTLCVAAFFSSPAPAEAGKADVRAAEVQRGADGTYRFDVTVAHGDEGWEHYADGFEIVSDDGSVLAERVLAHPHVNEQPFTRSLGNVRVPEGMSHVVIRAHDSVHGHGGNTIRVALPGR